MEDQPSVPSESQPQAPAPLEMPPSTSAEAQQSPAPAGNSGHYAGFWIRFVALLIDGILLGIVTSPIYYFTNRPEGISPLGQSLGSLIQVVYAVLMIGYKGATVGKMAMGLQVVRVDGGSPVGLGKAFLREVIGKFVSALVILLGFIWVAFDPKKQGWHDKIAGTYVIKK